MNDESILDGTITGRVVLVDDGLSAIFDMVADYDPALLDAFMRSVAEVRGVYVGGPGE